MKYVTSAIAFVLAICGNAQWTVVNLHPVGATASFATGVDGGQQVGTAYFGNDSRASLWSGTAGSWVDLDPAGASYSGGRDVDGGHQVGYAGVGGVERASLWSGSAGSWVDLHPTGASGSRANAVDGRQQAGYVDSGSRHASLWSGSAGSWVDLHPTGANGSFCWGAGGGQQVGSTFVNIKDERACLWTGSAGSWVDLHPEGFQSSGALDTDGSQQVGWVFDLQVAQASLWSGSAGSWVSLAPSGEDGSEAVGVHAGQQVGSIGQHQSKQRAALWSGSASSWVDLHAYLPDRFGSSRAADIWHGGAFTYVVGSAADSFNSEAIMWVSRSAAPTSYSMFRGSVISGNLGSLQSSDNNRLVMRPGAVFSSGEPPIQIILNATAPSSSPSGFSFSLESNASIANAEQKISLYNYDDEVYEVLDTRLATTTDNTIVVTVSTDTSRFIQPLTRAVRARVSYRALGTTFVYPWLGRIDKAWWNFPG